MLVNLMEVGPYLKTFIKSPGECVGILGPNGCGKTTLFSLCIGEQNVESGQIYLNRKSMSKFHYLRLKKDWAIYNKEVFLI